MFESVVPEVVARPSRRIFYETLPVSLVVHAAAIGGVVVSSLWNVPLPQHSPRMMLAYSLTKLPDPPPPPPPPPAAQPASQVVKLRLLPKPAAPPPPVTQIVAPTVIPDLIPQLVEAPPPPPVPVEAPVVVDSAPHPVVATTGQGKGSLFGEVGGKTFGMAGGITFAEDGRVHVDRNVKLPLKEIEKVYPTYPEAARKERLEDSCVLRYTIGTNGHVIDVAIIEHAKHDMFETESLNVIRQWRFRPMVINGKPVEVVHEVEFYYQFFQR